MIYYAHSKKIYGTKREREELKWLKKNVGGILNPNGDMDSFYDMDQYIKKVGECKELICSEFHDYVGRGVFLEVQCALDKGQKVRCIKKKDGEFFLCGIKDVKIFDKNDWAVRFGRIIVKED